MKKTGWAVCIFLLCLSMVFTADGRENEKQSAPIAVFPDKIFEFEPILEGTELTHAFVVQNKGTAELLIKYVKPG